MEIPTDREALLTFWQRLALDVLIFWSDCPNAVREFLLCLSEDKQRAYDALQAVPTKSLKQGLVHRLCVEACGTADQLPVERLGFAIQDAIVLHRDSPTGEYGGVCAGEEAQQRAKAAREKYTSWLPVG